MNTTGLFRKLPFHLTLVVLVTSFVSVELRYAYDFSVAKALLVWISTVIFCGLVVIGVTFLIANLDKREKEFYRRTGQKTE